MTDRDVHIHVRTTQSKRDQIDREAQADAMNRSEWVLDVIDAELRRREPKPEGRRMVVQTGRVRYTTPQRLCNHPARLRSEPHPVSGETVCVACNAVIRPLR